MARGFYETPPFSRIVGIHFPDDDGGETEQPTFEVIATIVCNGNNPAAGQGTTLSSDDAAIIARIQATGLFPGRTLTLSGFTPVNHVYAFHANISPQYMLMNASAAGDQAVSYTCQDIYDGTFGIFDSGTVSYGTLNVAAAGPLVAQSWDVTSAIPERDPGKNYQFLVHLTFTRTAPPAGTP